MNRTILKACAAQYLTHGLTLIKLGKNSKTPPAETKRSALYLKTTDAVNAAIDDGFNIGWLLTDGHMVIDVDVPSAAKPDKVGSDSFDKLIKLTGAELYGTVTTPSGGQHYYLSIDKNDVYHTVDKENFPDIDFLQSGRYVLIAGCTVNGKSYTWHDDNIVETAEPEPAPKHLLAALSFKGRRDRDLAPKKPMNKTVPDEFEIDESDLHRHKSGYGDPQVLIEELTLFNPDCDSDTWLKLAMCVKDAYPSNAGYKIFDRWCKGAYWQGGTPPPSSYNEAENFARWESIVPRHVSGQGTGIGTLKMLVSEAQSKQSRGDTLKVIARLDAAPSLERVDEIKRDIKRMTKLHDPSMGSSLSGLAEAYKNCMKRFDMPMTTAVAKRELKSIISTGKAQGEIRDVSEHWPMPRVLEPIVSDLRDNCYFTLNGPREYKNQTQLANAFGVDIPQVASGEMAIGQYLARSGNMKQVDGREYRPDLYFSQGSQFFDDGGLKLFNKFDPRTLPDMVKPEDWSAKDLQAVEYIQRHILMMCNDNHEYAEVLTSWLAHQIQATGVKVRWAPLIYGEQGIGKSTIAQLLCATLGQENVREVDATRVDKQFNKWASGHAVVVLEEVKQSGTSRTGVYDALKAVITNDKVEIEPKGVDSYQVRNVTNYIAFTNHLDAMAIPEDDRRWFIVWSDLTKATLAKITGVSNKEYFDKIYYDILVNHAPALRGWLMSYECHALPDERAPYSEYKAHMVEAGRHLMNDYGEVHDVISSPSPFWSTEFVVTTMLARQYQNMYGHAINNRRLSKVMNELGYGRHKFNIFARGVRYSVCARANTNVEALKVKLTTALSQLSDEISLNVSDAFDELTSADDTFNLKGL